VTGVVHLHRIDQLDQAVTVGVFQVEEGAEGPVHGLGQVRDLREKVVGRVRQDSPEAPPARSTVNSWAHDGQVTVAWVCRRALMVR
jgi:hypothetical protein